MVGSTGGNVTLEAGKDVAVTASDIISGQDTTITGQNVTIQAADNTDKEHDTYQFKQSGLSVSLGGRAIDNIQAVYQPAKRATEVEDSRLKALYDYKAVKAVDNLSKGKNADGSDPKGGGLSVSVSLGTTKQQSETNAEAVTAAPSQVTAGGDLNIISSTVDGKNIHLKAANDVNLMAADNTTRSETTSSGKSTSIGVSLSQGQAPGFFLGGNTSKGNENGNTLTHTNTQITATDTVTIESGEDTNLKGAKVKGKTVKVNASGDLNLESLQDEDNYKETNKSAGVTINFGVGGVSGTGSASKGKINSEYQSVTEQTGIYAGEGGFDIHVGKNTDLKGAVISSEATPDKNKLSTDTLTYSDIENHADYSASSVGVNLDTRKNAEKKDAGLTPNIGVKVSGDADSTTQSAISPGTIEIRSNPNQDISNLSRDPAGAVNALGKIFDKKTVQEKQELAKVFGEVAFDAIGTLAEREWRKAKTPEEKAKWVEGGEYKLALHTLVGGIMSDLGGSGFASGAVGAGISESVQRELANITNPALRQWASALVGAAAAKVVSGNGQSGASTAGSGIKNNDYTHRTHLYNEVIFVEGEGFYKTNFWNKDVYQQGWYPETGQVYWKQNLDDKSLGWEYVVGTGIQGDPYKDDTYIASWKNGYAYDKYDNQIIINGKGVFNPNVLGLSQEQTNKVIDDVTGMYSGVKIVKGMEGLVATTQVGDKIGRLGSIVNNPGITVDWNAARQHALNRMEQNGITREMFESYVKNGIAIKQDENTFLFLSREGVAIVSKDGVPQTAYTASKFKDHIIDAIKQVFGE